MDTTATPDRFTTLPDDNTLKATVVALRRVHLVLRDRRGRRVPRAGFSKERRLEPQITIGLLTDQDGFPLMVSAFEGNKAETKTMLPVIQSFMAAHGLADVTIAADAGLVSEANQKDIEAAGLSFILGMKIPHIPPAADLRTRLAEVRSAAGRGNALRSAPTRPAQRVSTWRPQSGAQWQPGPVADAVLGQKPR